MRNPRDLSAQDIADDLVKLNNLPKSDQMAHDALLQEVNGYFQYNINELKKEQAQAHAAHQDYDMRGNVISLFQTVKNYVGADRSPDQVPPINIAYFDFNSNGTITEGGTPQYTSREQPLVPTCFQISDGASKLSFSINTNGNYNADFLYQAFVARKANFPYKTWSQYWGGAAPSAQPYQQGGQPYQPGRQGKTKYEL